MKFSISSVLGLTLILVANAAHASVAITGDVTPGDPSAWMSPSNGRGYIGEESEGTLTVTNGSDIYSEIGYLGYGYNGAGMAIISGTGSTWSSQQLHVGRQGSGELEINDGGNVTTSSTIYIGSFFSNSTGTVTVSGAGSTINNGDISVGVNSTGKLNILDGGVVNTNSIRATSSYVAKTNGIIHFDNGTLNTGMLYAGSNQLTGSGTVNTSGLIADGIDLVFDATHGFQQTFNLNGPNQDIVLNIDYKNVNPKHLGAGFTGNGTLTIADGVVVDSFYGQIAAWPGSTGKVTVSGPGSTWNVYHSLEVGDYGAGELDITCGGLVRVSSTNIGIVRIDFDKDANSFINLSSGGMFALYHEADDSLESFLNLLNSHGTKNLRWWDDSINDWAPITTATAGTDYTLKYFTEGDLAGYTVLTVGVVPEPGVMAAVLSALLTLCLVSRRRKH